MSPRTKVFHLPNMRTFRSTKSLQRGYGIGGLFRGLIRAATPIVKKTLLSAGQKALHVGANVLKDVQENNVSAKDALLNQLMSSKTINRGVKRKSNSSRKSSKSKVRRKLETVTIPNL